MTEIPVTSGPARITLRAAAAAFNEANPSLWADVLMTPDQRGSTVTFYRRNDGLGVRPLARIVNHDDAVMSPERVEDYGSPATDEEQAAIDATIDGLRGMA